MSVGSGRHLAGTLPHPSSHPSERDVSGQWQVARLDVLPKVGNVLRTACMGVGFSACWCAGGLLPAGVVGQATRFALQHWQQGAWAGDAGRAQGMERSPVAKPSPGAAGAPGTPLAAGAAIAVW